MRKLYQSFKGQVPGDDSLGITIKNKQLLTEVINEAVTAKFKDGRAGFISGNELIVREVLMAYLIRILKADKALGEFRILRLEEVFSFRLSTDSNGSRIDLRTGGMIDRVDIVNGITRIVDYKTGNVAETVNSIGELFADDRKKDYDGWLQTLLYCEAYLGNDPGSIVRPSIYKIKKLTGILLKDKLRLKTDNRTELVIDDYRKVREEFLYGLKELIATIFSNSEPFIMTSDIMGKCSYCPYNGLCMR